jgi:hypothetical protein
MKYKSKYDGIEIKTFIDKNNSSEVMLIKENINFSISNLEYYKEIFQELKDDCLIIDCNYNDNIWVLEKDYGTVKIEFSFITFLELRHALKCYAILKLGRRYNVSNTIRTALKEIKKILLKTNNFSIKHLVDYRESICFLTDSEKQGLYYVGEFLRFYKINASDDYYDIISKTSIPPSKIRMLPSYKSIILFDQIINEYLYHSSIENRKKYFPLLLWWKISGIIPMRPIEFCDLKRNCYSFEESSNKYYIEIHRKKIRNSFIKYKNIQVLNNIQINKETYNLIREYAEWADPENKSEKLISYQVYNNYLGVFSQKAYNTKIDPNIMTTSDLRWLLQKFYIEVVQNYYNLMVVEKGDFDEEINDNQIERIQLGDTRHIAFCSLMLQGFNPLTIAQLGGHYTLREQLSYCSHLETFVDAHTYVLAKSIKNKLNRQSDTLKYYQEYSNKILERVKLGEHFYELRKTDGGRCKSSNFPYDCLELDHCVFCDFFIADDTLSDTIINQLSAKIEKEIQSKLDYIISITRNFKIYMDTSEYDLQAQEQLSTETQNLSALANRKAILNAYRMVEKGD